MKPQTITTDELMSAIAELDLQRVHPKGFSAWEFGEALGVSDRMARRRMRRLFDAGKLKCVGNRPVMRMDGKPGFCPIYKLVKKKS